MTHNQINAAAVRETKRHNLATEATESGKLSESIRHNKSDESIRVTANDNTRRFNDSTSAVNWFTAKQRALDVAGQNNLRQQQAQRLRDQSHIDQQNADTKKYEAWIRHYDAANKASQGAKDLELKGARLEIDRSRADHQNYLDAAEYIHKLERTIIPILPK